MFDIKYQSYNNNVNGDNSPLFNIEWENMHASQHFQFKCSALQ